VRKHAVLALFICFFVGAACGRRPDEAQAVADNGDRNHFEVAIRQDGLAKPQADLEKRISSAPAHVMERSGLAGAIGGAHVQVVAAGPQEVLLPIPQLADGQVPLCFFIRSTPPDAATEFRLCRVDDGNVWVRVRLAGKRQDIRIAWSSVVMLAPQSVIPNRTPADPYRKATACVQSGADQIDKLAKELWPKSGKASEFAANVQRHIRGMKGTARPRSLDALGILKSGQNGICTANANLAAALMRSKGIACRSMAVIPLISRRLEMHRIAEFVEDGRWIPFDPSSLSRDIPARPWQNIIMAKTTIKDEETAMNSRMSVMIGCPYGQEIEMLTPGVALVGADMLWTEAKPLAEFAPTDEINRLAAQAWNRYLETGTLTEGQRHSGDAKSAKELVELLKAN
jgi:Transglutaminase-like superfamily